MCQPSNQLAMVPLAISPHAEVSEGLSKCHLFNVKKRHCSFGFLKFQGFRSSVKNGEYEAMSGIYISYYKLQYHHVTCICNDFIGYLCISLGI